MLRTNNISDFAKNINLTYLRFLKMVLSSKEILINITDFQIML